MTRIYNRELNTAYHRARRERSRAAWASQPKTPLLLDDDTNDTVIRLHRGCGERVSGMHLRGKGGEVIRCAAGHRVKPGDWTLRVVRPVESALLPACDVSDRIVVEVLS